VVLGEKRGPESDIVEQRPPKSLRESAGVVPDGGLHRLQPGVPANRFVLPSVFAHGGDMLDGNTDVVVPEVEQAILGDMGPEAIKNELADATVAAMKLIEIANFLNGRERQFVQEKAGLEKKLKKQDGELRKAHADLRELDVSFEAYKDKYQLQLELTRTLEEREREADKLAEEKRILEGKVAELEGQLQKLAIPDEEERNEDPSGSLLTCLGEH
jgi:hypothetical protein